MILKYLPADVLIYTFSSYLLLSDIVALGKTCTVFASLRSRALNRLEALYVPTTTSFRSPRSSPVSGGHLASFANTVGGRVHHQHHIPSNIHSPNHHSHQHHHRHIYLHPSHHYQDDVPGGVSPTASSPGSSCAVAADLDEYRLVSSPRPNEASFLSRRPQLELIGSVCPNIRKVCVDFNLLGKIALDSLVMMAKSTPFVTSLELRHADFGDDREVFFPFLVYVFCI